MPNFFKTNNITKYAKTITVRDVPNEIQKSTFLFNNIGNVIKNISEGMTNQKIPCDKSAIFVTSLVSIKIQINANNDTMGIDAKILPAKVLLFEISEMATMVTEDNNTLII